MIILKLALRNLLGAGLRTWLNVIVLSFAFVIIIWHKGILDGWDRQAKTDMIAWETGAGQYRNPHYDPYDPFTLDDSYSILPGELQEMTERNEAEAELIIRGTLYPNGRMFSSLIKGIDPGQKLLKLPADSLIAGEGEIPAIIGSTMAQSTRLKRGDRVMLRWRDSRGSFDAVELTIASVFTSTVPSVDVGQIWIPLETLRGMMQAPGAATIVVAGDANKLLATYGNWLFMDQTTLLQDIEKIIKVKSKGGAILWGILLMLAMLAIFDTQVLSIFRRQKEIGTYVALGMTKGEVVRLFTIEGAFNAVLAALVGAVYGIPLLALQAVKGLSLPVKGSDYGLAMADTLYPVFGAGLIAGTVLTVLIVTTIVSFWPARKIAKMNPVEALRGRVQ